MSDNIENLSYGINQNNDETQLILNQQLRYLKDIGGFPSVLKRNISRTEERLKQLETENEELQIDISELRSKIKKMQNNNL